MGFGRLNELCRCDNGGVRSFAAIDTRRNIYKLENLNLGYPIRYSWGKRIFWQGNATLVRIAPNLKILIVPYLRRCDKIQSKLLREVILQYSNRRVKNIIPKTTNHSTTKLPADVPIATNSRPADFFWNWGRWRFISLSRAGEAQILLL